MKLKRIIVSITVIAVITAIVAFRLASNKQSFNNELKMVSESVTAIPILTDTVKYLKPDNKFSVNGCFSPSREISIASETQGKIISISANPGDKVITGQTLVSIDNAIYASQLEVTRLNLEKTDKSRLRFEKLSKGDAVTVEQYESAKQDYENALSAFTIAKIQFENTKIKAPFDGIITKKYVEKGAFLTPGTFVFDVVSINTVKFIARLTTADVEKVKKDQHVQLNADAYPGISYDGKISAIIIKADLSKQYDVEIEVDNRTNKLLKPGMYGTVLFTNKSNGQSLVIPRDAIAGSIRNPEIFLVEGDSVISQKISVSPLNDKYVIVNEGLNVGDIIVTSGQISLVNGSKIKLTNK
jgi:membrane fusion protein, multidrug efflux system